MKQERLKRGQLYQDCSGRIYQILLYAREQDTKEEKVIYQSMQEEFACLIDTEVALLERLVPINKEEGAVCTEYSGNRTEAFVQNVPKKDHKTEVEELFFRFLDAESSKEKMELLTKLKPDLDVRIVNNIAASMDLPADEDDVEKQYDFIMQNLKQRSKFECDRFR